jgi:hypothetical protein
MRVAPQLQIVSADEKPISIPAQYPVSERKRDQMSTIRGPQFDTGAAQMRMNRMRRYAENLSYHPVCVAQSGQPDYLPLLLR